MTRYDKTRAERNKEIVKFLRTTYPNMTLEAIGEEVSLTKERVRQILAKAELPTVSNGRATTKARPLEPCRMCGTPNKQRVTKHAKYCSKECQKRGITERAKQWRKDHPEKWTTYQCDYCGIDVTIRTFLYARQSKTYKKHFCSHYCNMKNQWGDKNSSMRNRKPRTNQQLRLALDFKDNK